MELLEISNSSVARILFLSLILGLNGCGTEQKEKIAGADEEHDSPPEMPIDLSQMEWNDELASRVGKIQHRGFPEGVAGTYVIRGQYWCLQAEVLPHTKRLFETDPLSNQQHKAVWGEALPANEE